MSPAEARDASSPARPAAPPRRLRIAWMEEWMSTLARETLPALARRHAVIYVTAGEELPRADFARVIRCHRWHHMNLAGFEMSHQVNRLYRDGGIDLALVWGSIGFALRGVPFVALDGTSVYAQIGLSSIGLPLHRRLRYLPGLVHYALPEALCDRRALRVVVPSRALKHDIVRLHGVPEERVAVVPHGAEPEHLACYARKRPAERTTILFVGRLHTGKGIADVLEEFGRQRDIDADFLVVGDGPERPRVERIAARDPRVKPLGALRRGRLVSLLATTHLFVLPSYYEGFGLALLEAMASGHACVAYDIPAVRELLGDGGLLVPPGDAGALVQAISWLTRDQAACARLARIAHARSSLYSWDEAVVAIDRIVRDVAATSVPPQAAATAGASSAR